MAENTVDDEITSLENKIKRIDDKLEEIQHLREIEEGGGSSRFRTQFAEIGKLYSRRDRLNQRLCVLYRSTI